MQLSLSLFLVGLSVACFTPSSHAFTPKHNFNNLSRSLLKPNSISKGARILPSTSFLYQSDHQRCSSISSSKLQMSSNDDDGPAFLTVVGVLLAIFILIGTSIAPTMDMMSGGGNSLDYNLSDSVVTRQDPSNKLKDYSNPSDKLSRSKIQEKLNTVPVFFLSESKNDDSGNSVMKETIYMSFQDAQDAAGSDSGLKVKATTLDQVTYPLIFKRGRMRMATPPPEIQIAEASLNSESKYQLKASSSTEKAAAELNLDFDEGDIPLYIADRLAFASNDGPQIPLFLEKEDCISSYNRLRKAGGNKLPEQPNIRTTTLLDVVESMEKGSRPAVKQIQFYASAEDLLRASEMLGY